MLYLCACMLCVLTCVLYACTMGAKCVHTCVMCVLVFAPGCYVCARVVYVCARWCCVGGLWELCVNERGC